MFRSGDPGCRKSGSVNSSPSGLLSSLAIGNDGWSVMTLGIIRISTSVSNSDVHNDSFSIDLVAVVIFPPLPYISTGEHDFLRESRSVILLEIRFTCDPESITARHVCSWPVVVGQNISSRVVVASCGYYAGHWNDVVAGRLDMMSVIHSLQPYEL